MSRFSEIIDKGIGKGIDFNEKDESGKSYADKLREDMDNMRENDEKLAKMHGSVHATMVSARHEEQRMMQSDTAEDEIVDYFSGDESENDDVDVMDDTSDTVSEDNAADESDKAGFSDIESAVSCVSDDEDEHMGEDNNMENPSDADDGFLDDVDSEYDDDIDESEDVSDDVDEESIVDERQLEAAPEDYDFGEEDELPVESESVNNESTDVSEAEEEPVETVDDVEDDNLPDPEPEDDVDYYYDDEDEEESESEDNTESNSADESAQLEETSNAVQDEISDGVADESTNNEERSEFLSLGEMRELVLGLSDEEAEAVSQFCNTDMFEGRREFVRLIERNNNIKVSPCDYKGLLDAFHMMYDEDMGKAYFEREKMVPVAAYGTKQVPFPSDEMLEYMYEHGYDSYGVTDSNRSVYK